MKFQNITFDILKKAIDLYLKDAYPEGYTEKSFCHENIDSVKCAENKEELLALFEKTYIEINSSKKILRYTIRLGSSKFPIMKLVLQEATEENIFGFLVDRHTEYLALSKNSKSFNEEKIVKEYSRKLKYKIEEEFSKNGIPTYREIIKNISKKLVKEKEKTNITTNGIKLLVAEDDPDVLFFYKLNLEIHGYIVDEALSGEIAMKKILHDYYDLVLLDLMMPVISGFEILRWVADEIPIIVISTLNDELSRKKCFDNGAKLFLTKPIEINSLDSKIKKILE